MKAITSTGASFVFLLIILLIMLISPAISRAQDRPLRAPADERGFFIGAAVAMSPFRNEPQYLDTLRREFNIIVAENAFKMDAVRPSSTTFNFTDTDALVSFAQANNMRVRGHTLVWHSQLPGWLTSGNFTRDQVIDIMRDHIFTLVGRYRGLVWSWDVVNEATNDSNGGLRTDSFWYQRIGPDYIGLAFEFARQADPDATLYYNDYSIERVNTKSNAVYNLVSNLKNQGVPINGVGWQMHQINGFRIQTQRQTNARRLAALGLEISMTEMDVRISLPTTADELQQQALAYSDSINFCLTEPNCKALVAWGFTDKYSWIPGTFSGMGDALIFNSNYQPKPAYFALLDVLEPEGQPTPPPATTGLAATAGNGQVTLSWNAASGAIGYIVKRSTTSGGPYTIVANNLTGTTFTNTGLSNGTTYFYVTSAVNASGESPNSAQVSATPQGAQQPPPTGVLIPTPRVATGSNPWWSELNVSLNHTTPLTALTITITVQKTTGVTGSGQYTNFPGGMLMVGRTEDATRIVYTYAMGAGQTLAAGTNRLVAAQFNGNGTAHPYAGDSWTVTYTTSGGTMQTVSGTF